MTVESQSVLPVQSIIEISGLMGPVLDKKGHVAVDRKSGQPMPGNLEAKLPDIADIIEREHRWFPRLVDEVREHKKSAIVLAITGGLMILAAVGTKYEFGVRHGEDIRHFYDRLQQLRKPQEPPK